MRPIAGQERLYLAITPRDDSAFLREVDEELRRDQLEGLARRHGRTALIVALVGLVVLAAVLIWNARRTAAKEHDAEQLTEALTDLGAGQNKKAAPALDALVASRSDGYRALALLARADMAVEAGKDADAIAQYRRVADDPDFAQSIRDLARVRGAAIAFDTTPPAETIARLAPLAKPGNPWFGSAGEMVAMAYRNSGRAAEAGKLFAAIARDGGVPDSIRSRATQMASALGIDPNVAAGSAPGESNATGVPGRAAASGKSE